MKVSVIGLGYVGSVAAAGLAAAGHDVLGIDIDLERVEAYRNGIVPIKEPGLSKLILEGSERRTLRFLHTDEVEEWLGDAIIIATGTPPTESGAADLSYVWSAVSWVKEKQPDGGVIVMKSTVPPGTGMRLLEALLDDTSLSYSSNPEFLREGQAVSDWFHPDRIVIGGKDEQAVETTERMYQTISAPVVTTDITSAEMIKYAANAFLATKISFINEIATLCDRLDATIDDVVKGIAFDPRIGSTFLRAGVGYGGSCFPKDTRALDHLALTNGHSFELLRAVIAVNNRQRLLPLFALRDELGPLSGVTVGILGLAFKPQTDDIRESPSIELIRFLVQGGASVKACDPMATSHAQEVVPDSVILLDNPLDCADGVQALILMTEWTQFTEANWEEIARRMRPPHILFDGRNALDPNEMLRLGFAYRGVGRQGVVSAWIPEKSLHSRIASL